MRRAHRDLRAALALLSMVAACNPQAFSRHHVASLLRFGFRARCPDALVTRHVCVALQRLVDGFQSGWVGGGDSWVSQKLLPLRGSFLRLGRQNLCGWH